MFLIFDRYQDKVVLHTSYQKRPNIGPLKYFIRFGLWKKMSGRSFFSCRSSEKIIHTYNTSFLPYSWLVQKRSEKNVIPKLSYICYQFITKSNLFKLFLNSLYWQGVPTILCKAQWQNLPGNIEYLPTYVIELENCLLCDNCQGLL